MKALTIVSGVVFLHVMAFVVLVNGCTPRLVREREKNAANPPQVVDVSEPTAGTPVVDEPQQPADVSEPTEPAQPAAAAAEPAKAEPASGEEKIYVVKKNDSLWVIAKNHGTTIDAICAANNINKNAVLRLGMKLKIPAGAQTSASSEKPAANKAEGGEIYVVKKGDALSKIARAHGVTVKALMEANGIANANSIRAGQKLVIPAKAAETKKEEAAQPAPAPEPKKEEPAPAPEPLPEPEPEAVVIDPIPPEDAEPVEPTEPEQPLG
ncbi:MAG: LysM peptidoglycan-binding domain-containing protein [Candidatus Spyradosoma sp.]